ncbi:MAG: hypothetical protein ACXAD7_24385 [Candidatus Kariarchaeaceae archaeon]|jgi:hypothetical protein
MTGEMHYIDPKTGKDSNGDTWIYHAAIAQSLGGTIKPFDVYQGPYIVFGEDMTVGNSPYEMPVQHLGIIRLWVTEVDDLPVIYREDTEKYIPFWNCEDDAIEAARELLND